MCGCLRLFALAWWLDAEFGVHGIVGVRVRVELNAAGVQVNLRASHFLGGRVPKRHVVRL